jgi:hypothetical protein
MTAVEQLRMLMLILSVGGRVSDAQLEAAERAAAAEQAAELEPELELM